MSGLDRSHISRIEKDEFESLQADTLRSLCKGLNCDPEEITGRESIRIATPYESNPRYRDLIDALERLSPEDRDHVISNAEWIAQKVGPGNVVQHRPREIEVVSSTNSDFVFPIPKSKFIEKEYDYPQPLHAWVVPEIPMAAGPHGIEPDFPLATAQILHSIRDVRNNLLQVIKVIGDSMAEVFRHGYKVLVDTTLTSPQNGDPVAVYVKDEGGMIGYWNKQGDLYSITKENPEYGTVHLGDPTEWLLWGTVTLIVEAPAPRRRR